MKKKATVNFVLGVLIGFILTFFTFTYLSETATQRTIHVPFRADSVRHIAQGAASAIKSLLTREDIEEIQEVAQSVIFKDEHYHNDDDSEAKALAEKVRVLCWVMTSPGGLDKKAQHQKNTWGKRCNILLFMSSEQNDTFPTVGLNVTEGRQHLTGKTMLAFRHVYENYFDQADWFMKVDDDTYVIVENLRYFLSGENTNDPVFFGHHFKVIVKQGYFSGGAGYILSKEALRRFGEKASNSSLCRQDGGAEDAEMGKCMQNLGVKVGNSTDNLGRSRFHCFGPNAHVHGGYPSWYYHYDAYGGRKGQESVSDYAITFHYVQPAVMYTLEYYTYHLRPYGIISKHQDLNQKKS